MRNTHFILFPLLLLILVSNAVYADGYPLDANDSMRIVNFLNAPSAVPDKTNGQQLNPDYDKDNHLTWTGFAWKDDNTTQTQRLRSIDIANHNLKGSLYLAGCANLYSVSCDNNALDSIDLQDSKELYELFCQNNKLYKLDLSGFTKLHELQCNNNNISQLDIRNSNALVKLKANNNNLTFTGLNMPLNPENTTEWDIEKQKPYLPKEIQIFNNTDYVSVGNVIDLSHLGGKTGTKFEWKYASNNATIPDDLIIKTGDFDDVFEFADEVMDSKVYCVITNNITHHDLEIVTVSFTLSYRYNINDLERIRTFLEKPSVVENVSNGIAVNPAYMMNDPRTFAVKWENKEVADGGGLREMRVVWINTWDEKGLAGELNLSGCEHLDRLIVKNNALTNIVFDSETKSMSIVDCSNNKLTQLDAAKFPQLINLLVSQNELTTLDISNNDKLSYLDCSGNNLNSLTLANLPNLKEIHCNSNKIKALSVELLENLERLRCDNNLIAELKTDALTKIQILSANGNLLEKINLSESKDLTDIYVNNNKLTEMNLSALGKINFLECANNNLNFRTLVLPSNFSSIPATNVLLYPQDTIAREKFAILDGIYISKGVQIDLSEYIYPLKEDHTTKFTWKLYDTATKESTIIGDPIKNDGNFTVPADLEGKMIFCEVTCPLFNNLTLVTPMFKATYKYAEEDVNALRKFLDGYSKFGNEQNGKTNGKYLSDKYLSNDPTTFPYVEWSVEDGLKHLKTINWPNRVELKGELDLTNCVALQLIDVSCLNNLERNDITKLILNECESLETILADYNQLETLSVLGCSNLTTLSASNNKLSQSLTVASSVIEKIAINGNKLSFVWVNNSPSLKTINVSDNLLEELNLEGNSALIELHCSNNLIKQIDISNLVNLKWLDIANNKFTSIDLSKQFGLSKLDCSHNSLTELNINHCIELVLLKCSGNALTALNLKGIDYLTHLEADGNNLVFTTIEYNSLKVPNTLTWTPQATISPESINEKRVLVNDSLVLTQFAERPDSETHYSLRLLNGDIVDFNLYVEDGGVITNFSPELSDKTLYCEMTNSQYPGLILRTVNFNTVAPMRYNSNDANKLRAFLEQASQTTGVTNGQYLSTNFVAEDPSTYPVTWVAVDSEFHLSKINWSVKPNLAGSLDLSGCSLLDTLFVTGMSSGSTGVNSANIRQCAALKVCELSYNALTAFDASTNIGLNILILAHNNISFIDVSNLPELEILDIIGNRLMFTNLRVPALLPVVAWEPQQRIIPPDLVLEAGAYKIKSPTISLSYLGNNLSFAWKNSKDEPVALENNNGVFTITKELHGQVLNCVITSNSGATNGLTLRTIDFLVDNNPTGILEQAAANVSLYPNPSNELVYIDLSRIAEDLNVAPTAQLNINIYDASGRFVGNGYSGTLANIVEIPIRQFGLVDGAYYLQVLVDGQHFMLNLIVE